MTLFAQARDCDLADPLRQYRSFFTLPEGVVYLDGNSLGALPKATPAAIARAVEDEWGEGLIRSWNEAGWFEMGSRIGAKIAPLIGAHPHEVVACDTVSANLFKLIAAGLERRPGRKVILSEPGNF
ncbi:MAG: kynureninase, partial [Pseudomonadota bacterium]